MELDETYPKKRMSAPRDACRHELWSKELPGQLVETHWTKYGQIRTRRHRLVATLPLRSRSGPRKARGDALRKSAAWHLRRRKAIARLIATTGSARAGNFKISKLSWETSTHHNNPWKPSSSWSYSAKMKLGVAFRSSLHENPVGGTRVELWRFKCKIFSSAT